MRFMIDMIGESCGSLIDLGELLALLTNNIVCRVALGKTYRGLEFRDLLARLMYLLGVFSVGSYIPGLSWIDRLSGLEGKTNKVVKEFDEFLEGVIEEQVNKKRQMDAGGGTDEGQDFVDILLDLQREKKSSFTFHRDVIKAVILDMVAAGTDTTSTNIEWAISELIRHPRVMKKLQQEVTEIAQGRSMITEDDDLVCNLHNSHRTTETKLGMPSSLPIFLIVSRTIEACIGLDTFDQAKKEDEDEEHPLQLPIHKAQMLKLYETKYI